MGGVFSSGHDIVGQVVLITGCSQGGMGFEIALAFARKGCTVYATSRSLSSMVALSRVPSIHTLELDVTNREQVEAVVQQVVLEQGRIDVLFNNAGCMPAFNSVVEADMEAMRSTFDTNFFGTVHMCQAVGRHMAQRRSGHIINNGSMASFIPTPFNASYSATKWAVAGLTHSLRNELRPLNVHVTYLAPGLVRSSIVRTEHLFPKPLPKDSPFKHHHEATHAKYLEALRGRDAEPADIFATAFVAAMLVRRPPAMYVSGGPGKLLWWLSWLLPPVWLDWVLCMSYGLAWKACAPAGQPGLPAAATATAIAANASG